MDDFARPRNLEEALALRAAVARRVVAGGTDLFTTVQGRRLAGPLLDVTAIGGLDRIEPAADGLRIGAAVTWSAIAEARLPPAFDGLRAAAREVGGWQIQNRGTIAGNICNASPAADGMPPLLTLDARVELASRRGARSLALGDFVTGVRRTALAGDEIVTAILIPEESRAGRSVFLKLGARAHLVISIASVACRVVASGGRVTGAAVAVGACSAVARRLPEIEAALVGLPLTRIAGAVDPGRVGAALAPIDDIRASRTYRAHAAAELIARALARLSHTAAEEEA